MTKKFYNAIYGIVGQKACEVLPTNLHIFTAIQWHKELIQLKDHKWHFYVIYNILHTYF